MNDPRYLVAGCKSWNRRVFDERLQHLPGEWHFISSPDDLSLARIEQLNPSILFFLHWSWKVPEAIFSRFECVCFHMTDVPYGRGGSPLQNLIIRGHRETRLSALRMNAAMDAGPVYLKRPLSLEGGAEEIFLRANELSADMIEEILRTHPQPVEQEGPIVVFPRRRPDESRAPSQLSLAQLHDFIRMLDADGYPAAFLDYGDYRLELSRSSLQDGRIHADVTITLKPKDTP